jgi:GNAT superfamily N-acetyltransferase
VSHVIRPATPDDIEPIRSWTQDTFAWGDYVGDAIEDWIEEPAALLMVCVDADGAPIAMSRAEMLSDTEGWLSAARVHPDHRRSGLGTAMNLHGVEWARGRGARVVRLATEEGNRAARNQVERMGYRAVGDWLRGTASRASGHRSGMVDRLRPTGAGDADAAWMFWSQSDLALAGRDLWPGGWRWRRAYRRDLDTAIEARSLYESQAGWVVALGSGPALEAVWMAVTPADAPPMLDGLRNLARERKKETVGVYLPKTPWTAEALTRTGFDLMPSVVYALSL